MSRRPTDNFELRGGNRCPHCGVPLSTAEPTRRTRVFRCRGHGGHFMYKAREFRCNGCKRLTFARRTEHGLVHVTTVGADFEAERERERLQQEYDESYAKKDRR